MSKGEEPKKRGVKEGTKRGKYRPRNRRRGGDRPLFKLTPEDAEAIWGLLQSKEHTQEAIAAMFSIGQEAVSHIATGTRWNSVTGLPRRTKKSTTPPPSNSRRGRKRSNYLKSLKPKPAKKQYEQLQNQCLLALLSGNAYVKMTVATIFKRPEGFPPLTKKVVEGNNMSCLVSARSMLNWLYKQGHSKYSGGDIDRMTAQVSLKIKLADMEVGLGVFKEFIDDGVE